MKNFHTYHRFFCGVLLGLVLLIGGQNEVKGQHRTPVEQFTNTPATGATPKYLFSLNNDLFFQSRFPGIATICTPSPNGVEIGVYPFIPLGGTPPIANETGIRDLNTSGSTPRFMKEYNGYTYFVATTNAGPAIFKSNGSVDLCPDNVVQVVSLANPTALGAVKNYYMTKVGNRMFLAMTPALPATNDFELWTFSSPSSYPTTPVNDETFTPYWNINPTGHSVPEDLTAIKIGTNDFLYLSADATSSPNGNIGNASGNRELHFVNATNNTTQSFDLRTVGGSNPTFFTQYNNRVYFVATNNTGDALYYHDGTTTPPVQITFPGGASVVRAVKPVVVNNILYFSATDTTNGAELWKIEGNNAPVLVRDIESGTLSSSPDNLTALGNVLYFAASTVVTGRELFRSQGTSATTQLVWDINGTSASSIPALPNYVSPTFSTPLEFGAVNGILYFFGFNSVGRYSLYRYNPYQIDNFVAPGMGIPTDPVLNPSLFFNFYPIPMAGPTGAVGGGALASEAFTSETNYGGAKLGQITQNGIDLYFTATGYALSRNNIYLAQGCPQPRISYGDPLAQNAICKSQVAISPTVIFSPLAGAGTITYAAKPAGIVINSSTGVINATASTLGTYVVTCTYDDGAGCFTQASIRVVIQDITTPVTSVSTLAGTGGQGCVSGAANVSQFSFGGTVNFANDANISVAYSPDGSKMYVADEQNHVIRQIIVATGVVSVLAGTCGITGSADGLGNVAFFDRPSGIATDLAGNIYVADKNNHIIRKINSTTTNVVTIAGDKLTGNGYSDNANPLLALFNQPSDLVVMPDGTIYVTDKNNHKIRRITSTTGVTTFAGSTLGNTNGTGIAAQFNRPAGIDVDANGNLYVADMANHSIRKIVIASAVVTTYSGTGSPGTTDGLSIVAQFNLPTDVAVGCSNILYVTDRGNHKIRAISANGVNTSTYAGTGAAGYLDGDLLTAQFNLPSGIASDVNCKLVILDRENRRIRSTNTQSPSGEVLGGGTVCFGTNTGTLTFTNYQGQPAVTRIFNWESSIDNGITWTNIGNANTANYTFNNLTQTTAFRVNFNEAVCGSLPSNVVIVRVDNPIAPVAPNVVVCGTNPVGNVPATITATGGFEGDFVWYNASNVVIAGQNNATLNVSISTTTNYFVSIKRGNCESPKTPVTVTVNPAPTPIISGTNNICVNATQTFSTPNIVGNTYLWTIAGGNASIQSGQGTNSVVVIGNTAGAGTLTVRETTPQGCNFTTAVYNIVINPLPTPNITSTNAVICVNSTGNYSTPSVVGNTYLWSATGSPTITNGNTNNASMVWASAGSFVVTVVETITATGCQRTNTFNVLVNPLPTPAITSTNAVVCVNQTGNYSTPSVLGNTYLWSATGSPTITNGNTNNASMVWASAGSFVVTVVETITATGCQRTNTFNVLVNPLPTPAITSTNAVICVNSTGNYSTPSVVGNTYLWSATGSPTITNGNTNNASMVWASAGSFVVTVQETITSTGCQRTNTFNVLVNPLPTPAITSTNTVICVNSTGNYSTPSVVGNTYLWSATGSPTITNGNTNNASMVWASAGSFVVTVVETITATGCQRTNTFNVTVNPLPTPTINGNITACGNSTETYTIATPTLGNTYTWTATNGTIIGANTGVNLTNIQVQWNISATAGTLKVVETNGTTSCIGQTTINISIIPLPSTNIVGVFNTCAGSTQTYQAVLPPTGVTYIYTWIVNGGTISAGQGTNNMTVLWGNTPSGTENVRVTIQVQGSSCSATTPLPGNPTDMGFVTLNALPDPIITGSNTVCANGTATYQTPNLPAGSTFAWVVLDGNGNDITTSITGQGTNQISVTWGNAGTGRITVKQVITATTCEKTSAIFNVTLNAFPNAPVAVDRFRCGGAGNVNLIVSTPDANLTYNWFNVATGGTSLATGSTVSQLVSVSPTDFWVEATNANGCRSPRTKMTVTLDPPNSQVQVSVIATKADSCVASGNSPSGKITIALLNNPQNTPYTYSWTKVNDVSFNATTQNLTGLTQGIYNLTITDGGGCTTIVPPITIQEDLKQITDARVSNDTTIARGSEITLTAFASNATKYMWVDTQTGQPVGNTSDLTITPTQNTTYSVIITNNRNCSITKLVKVELIDVEVFVPNMFSPNGDNKNDFLKVYGKGIKNIKFQVYSRLGELVYETTEWVTTDTGTFGWDGSFGGKPLQNGNYTWYLTGEYINGTKINYQGRNTGNLLLTR